MKTSRIFKKKRLNEVGWVVGDEVFCEECIKYNKQLKTKGK